MQKVYSPRASRPRKPRFCQPLGTGVPATGGPFYLDMSFFGLSRALKSDHLALGEDAFDTLSQQPPGSALFIGVVVVHVVPPHLAAGQDMVLTTVDHLGCYAEGLHHRRGRAPQVMRGPLAVPTFVEYQ